MRRSKYTILNSPPSFRPHVASSFGWTLRTFTGRPRDLASIPVQGGLSRWNSFSLPEWSKGNSLSYHVRWTIAAFWEARSSAE